MADNDFLAGLILTDRGNVELIILDFLPDVLNWFNGIVSELISIYTKVTEMHFDNLIVETGNERPDCGALGIC